MNLNIILYYSGKIIAKAVGLAASYDKLPGSTELQGQILKIKDHIMNKLPTQIR